MKWNRKGDLVLGYFGIILGLFASGLFIKIAMLVDDPFLISVYVILGCSFLIEMTLSCMLVLGVYEREGSK
jgi:hypothetical protein